jgi:ring-1,2-phenylacetyl-CoA epoxidase subunit PaaD
MINPAFIAVLQGVTDPEIPVLSVIDMGVIRAIEPHHGGYRVDLTPTYSGCPAMDVIGREIQTALESAGYGPVTIRQVLNPPWTTDFITAEGRARLLEYGIAPPVDGTASKRALFGDAPQVACPRCKSLNTKMISQFGSTACKAQYTCQDCLEPFDYFKCI